MPERPQHNPEIYTTHNQWMQQTYNEGVGFFNALGAQYEEAVRLRDSQARYGTFYNGQKPEYYIPEFNAEVLNSLFPTTYKGFMISTRLQELQRERVEPHRFHRRTANHELAVSLEEVGSINQIEHPARYVLAWNHAKVILGLLQQKSSVAQEAIDLLFEDSHILTSDDGPSLDTFLEQFDEPEDKYTKRESIIPAAWAGDGTIESVVTDVIRLNKIVERAQRKPSSLSGDDIRRCRQFFTLGQRFWNEVALNGENVVGFYERMQEENLYELLG